MIILYDKNKTNGFNRNDLVLHNVTKCDVTWEKNGQFQIDLVYPIIQGDTAWQQIVKGAIIKCPVAYQQDQLFRLNTPSKKMDENSGYFYLEITGYHITYDLNDNFLEDVRPTQKSGIEAGRYILANTQYSHPFRWVGDITDINTAYYIRKNPINALIGDDDNSYLSRWGGELVRDNFNIGMYKQAGQNRGIVIRYSKNLTGFEQTGDDSNLMTRCLPYCTIDTSSTDTTGTTTTAETNTDEDLKPVLKLPEKYIDSPLISNYSHPYVKAVEVQLTTDQQKLTDEQKYTVMRNYVADLYSNKHVDVPVYSYSVNFIDLANTEEYKEYAILEEVKPYDYVTVKALDVDVIAELVGYTFNSLIKQYNTLTLGNIQNDIIRHNQKSLFQISKQNEQSIRILQAQMQDVPNSMLDIVTQTTSGGNNLFDHSILEDKYTSEWTNNGASVVSDNTLHDTDKVWELPAGANVTKQDIILNPDSYKGQQLTFSLSAKYSGLDITYDSSLGAVSSAKLGSISIKYKKCLANSIAGNWITNGNTGIITDYIPIDAGKAFTISNSEGYAYKLLAYDSSYNFVEDFTSSTSTPNYPFIRVEIDKSNMYPESITGFSIYENTEREFQDVAYLYADSVSSDWKVCSTTFALATANSSDVITHVNFTASNEDSSGTIYVAGFMLNTGTVRSDYSQSSNDTVQTLRVHEVITDYVQSKKADIDNLHAALITVDDLQAKSVEVDNLKASVGEFINLDTNTLKAQIITANNIKTGTITADSGIIATGAIQTAQIADGSVTDEKVVSMTANKLTAGEIDASKIEVINLNCASLTVGTINGQQISKGAITIDKLESSIGTAIESAQGKSKNFYGADIPSNPSKGDLWMKPVDGGIKPQQWDGSSWVDMTDITAIKAQEGLNNLSVGVNNLIRNGDFSQGVKPGTTAPYYWGFWGPESPEVFGSQGVAPYNLPRTLYIGHRTVNSGISQDVTNFVKPNTTYTVLFSSHKEGVDNVYTQIEYYDSNSTYLSDNVFSYNYSIPDTLQCFTFTTPSNFGKALFAHGGTAQIWQSGYLTTLGNVTLVEGNKAPSGWVPNLADMEDASFLRTGTINADRIGANSITADKLVAGSITSASGVIGALDAGAITTGVINAERLGAETITTDKIYCNGSLNNVALNVNVNYSSGTQSSGGMCAQGHLSTGVWGVTQYPSTAIVDLGGEINQIREISFDTFFPTDGRYIPKSYLLQGSTDGTTWTTIADVTDFIPTSGTFIRHALYGAFRYISLIVRAPQDNQSSVNISNFKVMCMQGGTIIDGNMILTGSIEATRIHANTITGDKLVEDAITAREIASKTITANEIASNTITADKIQAGTLTSASGVFGDISADNIKTGTLDASIVNVTNLNASNITSGTITADRINGGTLTLGGGNNGNGLEIVKDDRGLEIVRVDNNGLTITMQLTPDGYGLNRAFEIKAYNGDVLMTIDGQGQMNYYGAMAVRSLETTGNMITYADGKQALKTANVIEMSVINDANNDNSTYLAVNTSLHNRGIQSWISDIRLKENIKDSEVDALSKICAIKCRQFDWKESHTHQDLGVVSQELRKIEPTMAYGVKQPDDSLLYQPDESILIPYLIKSVQQLKQEIETLKTEISQLKGSI
ncbi:phage tail spike protein [Clostridium felsineum]|uniref:Uncharacterized protein n=1 Tax=Clostridium felsineum TaxID=36839 RepID=A0A1S8MDV5_9CLOT|nr:phage tail spike protein [Clostridium felsineum]URZ06496.1 hypothetical protein CLROS_018290 [Clostridium felsineum]URZ11531.1 hypothetical protein CROST_022480 [Clostridium felsineum]